MKKLNKVSRGLLDEGLNIRISTHGSSMFPIIKTGDRITISPEKYFHIGNLIAFRRDDQMVCHRLVKVFESRGTKYYQTRGDSFFSLDEPVTSDQILGRVTKIERRDVSFARRTLILIHPVLKFGRLNAFVVAGLIKLKAIFPVPKAH